LSTFGHQNPGSGSATLYRRQGNRIRERQENMERRREKKKEVIERLTLEVLTTLLKKALHE
jgi:hypothetical protein